MQSQSISRPSNPAPQLDHHSQASQAAQAQPQALTRLALENELTEWCRDARPSENRIAAKHRILRYFSRAAHAQGHSDSAVSTLNLSSLGLQSRVSENRVLGLPECLLSLPNLKFLNLSNNAFQLVPTVIGQLGEEVQVNLSGNPLEPASPQPANHGVVADANPQTSRRRSFDNNHFWAPLMGKLPTNSPGVLVPPNSESLDMDKEYLNLLEDSNEYLQGAKPGERRRDTIIKMYNCSQLHNYDPESASTTGLNLSGLNLTELPNLFHLLTKLRTLNLSGNDFSELHTFPASLSTLRNLESIDLRGCDIRDIPDMLRELPSTCLIDLRNNPLNRTAQMVLNLQQNLKTDYGLEKGPTYLFDNIQIQEACRAPTALHAVGLWRSKTKETLDANNIRDLNGLIEALGEEKTEILNSFLLKLNDIPHEVYPEEEMIDKANTLIDFLTLNPTFSQTLVSDVLTTLSDSPDHLLTMLSDCLASIQVLTCSSDDSLSVKQVFQNLRGALSYFELRASSDSKASEVGERNIGAFRMYSMRELLKQIPMDFIATTQSSPVSAVSRRAAAALAQRSIDTCKGEKLAVLLSMDPEVKVFIQRRLPEVSTAFEAKVKERLDTLKQRKGDSAITSVDMERISKNSLYEVMYPYLKETGY